MVLIIILTPKKGMSDQQFAFQITFELHCPVTTDGKVFDQS